MLESAESLDASFERVFAVLLSVAANREVVLATEAVPQTIGAATAVAVVAENPSASHRDEARTQRSRR